MQIRQIRAGQPRTPHDPGGWRTTVGQILVVVETDGGVLGLGIGGGGRAGICLIEDVLAPLLVGQPLDSIADIERHWERLYQETLPFGRKGLVLMAISGIDLALWDALGKATGRSVAQLLGGPRQRLLPCYATGNAPEAAVAQGYGAVKISVGHLTAEQAIEQVARTREAIGPHVRLYSDASMRWDRAGSHRAAQAFAAYEVGWLEEPLPPDDLDGYAALVQQSPIPIAGGEHEYTVHGFRELAARRAHTIWQPDVCWTGGLTQLRAIYALAAEEGIRVVPHRGSEVWGLHAIAALDPQPLAESGRPWITWLQGQPPIVNGQIEVPDRPGFGVGVAPEVLNLSA